MSTKEQWGWMPWGRGQAHGPFDSREEAFLDAKENCEPGEEITINTIWYPDFLKSIPDAVDFIIQVDESISGDWGLDEPLFEFAGSKMSFVIATAELREALAAWAHKWVDTTMSWVMTEGEKIVL